jgi:hypothetical protein
MMAWMRYQEQTFASAVVHGVLQHGQLLPLP